MTTNAATSEPEPVRNTCGRGICAAESGHEGTCDEASGWAEEASSQEAHDRASLERILSSSADVRPSRPRGGQSAPDSGQVTAQEPRTAPSWYPSDPTALNGPQNRAERVTDAEAAEWALLAAEATEGPWVVEEPPVARYLPDALAESGE